MPFLNKEEKFVTVMYQEVGDLAGLEALNYIPDVNYPNGPHNLENDESQEAYEKKLGDPLDKDLKLKRNKKFPLYKTSLRSIENETIVIHIKISALNEFRETICMSLRSLKNEKDLIIENLIRQKIENMNKHKVVYREKQIRRHMKNTEGNEYDQRMHLAKLNECIDGRKCSPIKGYMNFKNLTIKVNKEFLKTFKAVKDKSKTEKTLASSTKRFIDISLEKKIFDESFYDHLHCDTEEAEVAEESKFIKIELEKEKENNINLNENPIFPLILRKTPLISSIKNMSKLKLSRTNKKNDLMPLLSDQGLMNSYGTSTTEPSTQRNVYGNDLSINDPYFTPKHRGVGSSLNHYSMLSDADTQTDRNNSKSIREKIFQSLSTLPQDENGDDNFKPHTKFTTTFKKLALTPLKNKKIPKEQDKEGRLFSKEVGANLKQWDKSLNTNKFMSGRFDIPLVCFSQKKN
jgi:hypothetical protein